MRPPTFAVVFLFISVAAFAQNRTFVSVNGSDANLCTSTSPCRSFSTAVAAVTAGGEVIALDSGGYGPVVINKSVSIIAPNGVYAGVTVTSGSGIVVNSGGGIVVLRGLSINGVGAPTNAIELDNAQELHVENVAVSNFEVAGAALYANSSFSSATWITVRDCEFRDVGYGVSMQNSTNGQNLSVDHVRFDTIDGGGINVFENDQALVSDCSFFNTNYGILLHPSAGFAEASVDRSTFAYEGIGVWLDPPQGASANAHVGRSTFVNSSYGVLRSSSGSLTSWGNNQFAENTTDGVFDATVAVK